MTAAAPVMHPTATAGRRVPFLLLLGLTARIMAEDTALMVELQRVRFAVDRPGRTEQGCLFYTAQGNNISFMVRPRTDPAWILIRTPDEALRNAPAFPLKAGERMVERHQSKNQRKDGAWCVTCECKVAGSRPRDDVKAATSWHISRYVYIGDQIIIMQGCWLKNGDIDQDHHSVDVITGSITLK